MVRISPCQMVELNKRVEIPLVLEFSDSIYSLLLIFGQITLSLFICFLFFLMYLHEYITVSLNSLGCRSKVCLTETGSTFPHCYFFHNSHLFYPSFSCNVSSLFFVSLLHFHLCWLITSFYYPLL